MAQVSLSSDGKTTSFDITAADVAALASTKQRWAVQCKPINDWTDTVGLSAVAYAATGALLCGPLPTDSGRGMAWTAMHAQEPRSCLETEACET